MAYAAVDLVVDNWLRHCLDRLAVKHESHRVQKIVSRIAGSRGIRWWRACGRTRLHKQLPTQCQELCYQAIAAVGVDFIAPSLFSIRLCYRRDIRLQDGIEDNERS